MSNVSSNDELSNLICPWCDEHNLVQESLDLLAKILEEADPNEFLEDFLEFQKQSEGGVTVLELIDTFGLDL